MKYYKISEVSKITGVAVETIRYWEKRGLIKPDRKYGNRRFYTYNTIRKIMKLLESREKQNLNLSKSIKKQLKEILDIIKDTNL
ncbi:MAG: MerR family transcriptional regulator [candidate division WOR-3 bacterium]|nr:MerR family transcriptional regulator [candidate division WOR-3 bacterium]MCX7947671.1 MerR family transcriptional regulator [candidate division WOR-3 bacterium]MDW8150548.1 MerR family transcriptional regulator [candidate division WOR-3 bacterium]